MATEKKAIRTELPHDLLAEKSFLGCLLLDGQAYDEINDLNISSHDFFHPQYRMVFEAIRELIENTAPVDFISVCSKLADKGKLELLADGELNGKEFVLGILEEQATSANIYHYAKTVKEKSTLRSLIKTAMSVVEKGMGHVGDTQDFLTEVESKFFKLTQEGRSGKMQNLASCLIKNLKDLEDTSRNPGDMSGLTTGYKDLDSKLLGLQPGQLVIIAARPAMGKTAFAVNIAMNAVKATGLPVAIFSLEMMAPELSARILCCEARVDSKKLRMKNLQDNELKRIGNAIQRLSSSPVYINDSGSVTVLDINSECRKIKAEGGLGLIVVDYIQLLKPMNAMMPREGQISEMSRYLKQMAKELECPVVALSQLNRAVETRNDKRPQVADLRESGALEQDADLVMLIYRDEVYNPDTTKEPGVAEIIIGKNRSGETGTAKLTWKGPYYSFENLAVEAQGPRGPQAGRETNVNYGAL